jgi:TolB-like protein/Tfp pilus assembly protein PilF
MSVIVELKRRNVFRVAAAYAVVAWLLIEISDTVFPRINLPEWTVTLVIALLLLGFPLALFLAWAYELTPEGIRRTGDVTAEEFARSGAGRKADSILIAVLVLALGYLVWDKFMVVPGESEPAPALAPEAAAEHDDAGVAAEAPDPNSIVVLPFANLSDDPANEFFSDGISEELLNLLTRIPELRVTSRSSAFYYKGLKPRLAEVAAELNVAHVLEGSVRKAGNRVRITAQLSDTRSDTRLWSQAYDRSLDDIFAIQDEIAAAVVRELEVHLFGGTPRAAETSSEAYALFLQARYLARVGTPEGYEDSNALYARVLEIDPDYVPALVGMSGNYQNQAEFGYRDRAEGYLASRRFLQRALAIEPGYAVAHSALGWDAIYSGADLGEAAAHFERAVALGPTNIDVLHQAAIMLGELGRFDEAIVLQRYVAGRDPITSSRYHNLGWSYFSAGRWEESMAAFRQTLTLSPGAQWAHYHLAVLLLIEGEPREALAMAEKESAEPARLLALMMTHHALGNAAESAQVFDQVVARHERHWASYIAAALAFMGETERAFEWLERSKALGNPRLTECILTPYFRSLHQDPRWLPFLESIGRSPAQLASIPFRVEIPQ